MERRLRRLLFMAANRPFSVGSIRRHRAFSNGTELGRLVGSEPLLRRFKASIGFTTFSQNCSYRCRASPHVCMQVVDMFL